MYAQWSAAHALNPSKVFKLAHIFTCALLRHSAMLRDVLQAHALSRVEKLLLHHAMQQIRSMLVQMCFLRQEFTDFGGSLVPIQFQSDIFDKTPLRLKNQIKHSIYEKGELTAVQLVFRHGKRPVICAFPLIDGAR